MPVVGKLFLLWILTLALMLSGCSVSAQNAVPHALPTALPKPSPTIAVSPSLSSTPAVGNPVHLIIPRLGVNAPIENVGIQPNGDLATPIQNPWDGVGWYNLGTRPGELGSAVIDGHLDRPGGYPAVFWNLHDLRIGDSVMVVDAHGKTMHFRVTRLASYPPQQAPVQEIFGDTSGTYLNLITCAGTWIASQGQTTLRLVVYTSLASSG